MSFDVKELARQISGRMKKGFALHKGNGIYCIKSPYSWTQGWILIHGDYGIFPPTIAVWLPEREILDPDDSFLEVLKKGSWLQVREGDSVDYILKLTIRMYGNLMFSDSLESLIQGFEESQRKQNDER
jgi:hypothetical protein